MELNKKIIKFARTKNGIPSLWESLRRFPTMERITCIFDPNGDQLEPIFQKIGSNSSLVPIKENYLILKLFYDKDGCGISLFRINSIDCYSNDSEVELIKRKANDITDWAYNSSAEQLSDEVSSKIDSVINTILEK